MPTSDPTTDEEMTENGSGAVSYSQVLVYELRVRDAMTKSPITAAPSDSLRSIQHLMKRHRISGVPITLDGRLLGIITIEDIIIALDQGYINDSAEHRMTRDVLALKDHYSLVRAVAEFDRHGFGRFPVLDSNGKLVGIMTSGDITACLMHHIERRAHEALSSEAALIAAQTPEERVAHRKVVRAHIKAADFDSAGKISERMRHILRERGTDPEDRRRAAIVVYEAETNIIIHSLGGQITATILPDKVVIDAIDEGPGIQDVNLAMQEGWSTAGPLARELGFGAGMGLPNIKRCADKFEITSSMGSGTKLHADVFLRKARKPL